MEATKLPPPGTLQKELDPETDQGWLWLDSSPEAIQSWIEKYLTVDNERGEVVKMKLYPQQIQMLHDECGRDVTIKGRQTRASTLKLARRVRRFVSGEVWSSNCLIAADTDPTTQIFRRKIQRWIADLRRHGFSLKLQTDNEDEMLLADYENRFIFGSGEQHILGRGFAIQEAHLSEFAHWKEAAISHMGSILPAVPGAPVGRVDIESTPKGEIGAFYTYATNARPFNPYDLWTVHFYPWWLEPRYRVTSDPAAGCDILLAVRELTELRLGFHPSEQEQRLMTIHNLELDQILWRRIKKREQDKTPHPFLQEFPESIETCFIGVQGKYFDTPDGIDHLEYYRDEKKEPLKYLEKLTYNGQEVSFYGPNLALWELPDYGSSYLCWFDAAGGGMTPDSDWSVLYVYHVRKEKIVARLRVQAPTKVFAAMACAIGAYYNTAYMGGERSHQGENVLYEMRDLLYPNIYYHVDPRTPLRPGEQARPGIYPTSQNRQRMLEDFKIGIITHALQSHCSELVKEMGIFTWQKFQERMKASAQKNQHDDCVMAAAGGYYVLQFVRTRVQRHERRRQEEVLVVGRNGLVLRREQAGQTPRSQKLWLN